MRVVEPDRWEVYAEFRRRGYTTTAAAREAGISRSAAERFERGDPRSSGQAWLRAVNGPRAG